MIGPNNRRPNFNDDIGLGSRCLDLLEKIAVRYDPQKQKVDKLQRFALTDAERLQAEADGLIGYKTEEESKKDRYRYKGPRTRIEKMGKPRYDNITNAVAEIIATPAPWPWGYSKSIAYKYKIPRTSLQHRLALEMKKRGLDLKHFRNTKKKVVA